VQDIFLTETAKMANVVLPASCWAEKDGTFTNSERRDQRIRKAVNAPGEALSDWEIIKKLAENMGYGDKFNFEDSKAVFNEICKVNPGYSGMNYEKLGIDGIHWPCRSKEDLGTPILHTEKFSRANGLGKIVPVEFSRPSELSDSEYPFVLTTGRIIFHYNAGSMTRRCKSLKNEIDVNFIEINTENASEYKIKTGDMLKISSRRGSILAKAKVTDNIRKNVTYMPFHFSESNTNILTNSKYDKESKTAELKACAIKIEKI